MLLNRPTGASPGALVKKPIQFGKYYLLDRINVGGMAEVFKAKAFGVEGFEKILAIKRILPSMASRRSAIACGALSAGTATK